MAKKKTEELGEEVIEKSKEHFIIEEHDFKMESSHPNDVRFFDLYFTHTVNRGKDNERQEFKLEGYGIQLKNCLRRICAMRAGKADKKQFSSFKEFVLQYQAQVAEVKRLFDLLPENFE